MINLHGAGATGGTPPLTNYNAVADQHGFAVVYPDGIDLSWADGRGASVPDRQGVDDVGFLVALADRLTHDYGIAPGRVRDGSVGGGLQAPTGLRASEPTSSLQSRPLPGRWARRRGCAPSRPVSVFATHGASDPVVPYNGGPMVGRGGPSDIVAPPAMAGRRRDLDHCPPRPSKTPSAPRCTASRHWAAPMAPKWCSSG